MGYFSKTCAKSHLPITVQGKGWDQFNKVVALTPEGRVIRGAYDGYGCIGDENLRENVNGQWIWEKVKFVLEPHYNGETYHELPRSGDELGQGYFMSNDFLVFCASHGAFKNRAAYVRAFKKYANWL